MDTFTRDELFDLEYAVTNLIDDKNDYCADDDTAEHVGRLGELQAKIQGLLRAGVHADRIRLALRKITGNA